MALKPVLPPRVAKTLPSSQKKVSPADRNQALCGAEGSRAGAGRLRRAVVWLAAAWRDLWRVLRIGLCYGAAIAVVSLALAVTLLATGWASLVMALRR